MKLCVIFTKSALQLYFPKMKNKNDKNEKYDGIKFFPNSVINFAVLDTKKKKIIKK